jgi:chemotaxis protein MotA
MDLATVIGIFLSFGLVISAIVMGGSPFVFVSIPSALIVIGGTLGATLVNYPLKNVFGVIGIIKNTFFHKSDDPASIIDRFLELANKARREGILSLEPALKEVDDSYLRKGLQLTVHQGHPGNRNRLPRGSPRARG